MQNLIYSFSASGSTDHYTLYISLALMAIAGIICYAFLKPIKAVKMDSNMRKVVAMLGFFAAIIAMSTAFFSFWNIQKTGNIAMYENGMRFGNEEFLYTEIRNATIKTDKGTSFINPDIDTRTVDFLLIEEKNGKVHAISGENYPVGEILTKLREMVE